MRQSMRLVRLEKLLRDVNLKEEIAQAIKDGEVFIYPTDTVYGLGCDAGNPEAVTRIRKLKGTDHPFSVIAPSRKWIGKSLVLNHPGYLDNLPGPYTLIFRKKAQGFLPEACPRDSVGVRIPDHPLTRIIQSSGKPFVTTSANKSGRPTIKRITEIPKELLLRVDTIIDGGILDNPPSTVIDLTGREPVTIR